MPPARGRRRRLPAALLLAAALSLAPAAHAAADDQPEPDASEATSDGTAPAVAYKAEIVGVEDAGLRDLLTASSQLIQLKDRPPETLAGLERRAKSDLERLTRALRSEGYYAAEVSHSTDPDSQPVDRAPRVLERPAGPDLLGRMAAPLPQLGGPLQLVQEPHS